MFYSEAQVDEGMSFGIKMSALREYCHFTFGSPEWISYSEGRQRKKYFQLHFLTSGLAALVWYNLIGLILKLKDKH